MLNIALIPNHQNWLLPSYTLVSRKNFLNKYYSFGCWSSWNNDIDFTRMKKFDTPTHSEYFCFTLHSQIHFELSDLRPGLWLFLLIVIRLLHIYFGFMCEGKFNRNSFFKANSFFHRHHRCTVNLLESPLKLKQWTRCYHQC